MEDHYIIPFPYEIKDYTTEEQEYVDKVYGSIVNVYRLCRIGPKGYAFYEPYKKDAANIYNMAIRPTDIFVSSYQRSGTTMTQELVWLLENNLDYSKAAAIPLTQRYTFLEYFMFFVGGDKLDAFIRTINSNLDKNILAKVFSECAEPVSKMLAKIPLHTPRFFKTHIPLSLLNPKLLDTTKMVYIARDPRDVAVSCYYCAKLFKVIRCPGGFKEFWNLFHKDMYVYCPIFEHVKEAWEKRHHPNMLFLFYEEFVKDLPTSIRQVANFLGKSLLPEQIDRLCEHLSFENFKKKESVNQVEERNLGMLDDGNSFIRRGKPGGWRDYFDEEMIEQAEQWITKNLQHTDLRYPCL